MTVRMRDVRVFVREMGFEKGVVHSLELLIEENIGLKQSLAELAELQAMVIDNVEKMTHVGDNMSKRLDEMKRKEDQHAAVKSEPIDLSSDDKG